MKEKNLSVFFIALFLLTFTPAMVHAQNTEAPKLINLQAVLVDEGGNVLYDQQEADIIFSIVDGAGETFYEEIQHVVLVNGAISVLVGEGKDVSSGGPKGGIPIEALSPDGTKLLRVKLADQSIPQEDLQLASVPYAMYAQQAYGLVDPLEASLIIKGGTIDQIHLSQDLLNFINTSVEGVSQADLLAHKTEEGAHNAETISVENTFINASGTNLAQILVGLDRSIGTRRNEEGVLGDAIDTETADRIVAVATEATARDVADVAIRGDLTAHTSAIASVHGVSGNVVGTTDIQTLTSKTLTTPVIADFTSAGHSHQTSAGGGTLDAAAIVVGELPDARVSNTLTIGDAGSVADVAIADTLARDTEVSASVSTHAGTVIATAHPNGLLPIARLDTDMATQLELETHAGISSGVHGVAASGSIVGTDSTQTLKNKTLEATTMTGDLAVKNGPDGSEVARIAASNGNITTIGTVDGVDISELNLRASNRKLISGSQAIDSDNSAIVWVYQEQAGTPVKLFFIGAKYPQAHYRILPRHDHSINSHTHKIAFSTGGQGGVSDGAYSTGAGGIDIADGRWETLDGGHNAEYTTSYTSLTINSKGIGPDDNDDGDSDLLIDDIYDYFNTMTVIIDGNDRTPDLLTLASANNPVESWSRFGNDLVSHPLNDTDTNDPGTGWMVITSYVSAVGWHRIEFVQPAGNGGTLSWMVQVD